MYVELLTFKILTFCHDEVVIVLELLKTYDAQALIGIDLRIYILF